MNREKPITPYQRLLTRVKNLAWAVKYARRKTMWVYPKARLNETWTLGDLYERARAADQLGYDVVLKPTDEALVVQYVERPSVPYEWA